MEEGMLDPTTMPVASRTSRPLMLEFRSSQKFILTVVTIAVFTDTFFYTLIIPILPNTLEERAGIPLQAVQKWVSILLSTYALTNLATSPIAGIIIDRSKTRRAPLLVGLIAMAASTTMYMFGRTVAILVVARALQGASAAIIRVGGLALITDTFGADNSGAAMGWQSVGMFVGTVTGPSISGILYDNFGHYAVFAAAYSVLAIDIVLRLTMIERKVAAEWVDIDIDDEEPQTSGPQDRLLEQGVVRSSYTDPSSANVQGADEQNVSSSRPKFSVLSLLLNRRLLTALWATFACAIIMTALESIVPLYTMRLFSWTPTQTGLLLISLAVSVLIDPVLGSWTDKYGSRWFSVIGFAIMTLIYLALTAITHDNTAEKAILCALLVGLGFAVGSVMTPNMVEISLLVHAAEKSTPGLFRAKEVMGQAYAMLSVAYGLGSLVGPAWGGILMVTHGWIALCLSFTALAGVSSIVMLLFAGEHKGYRPRRSRFRHLYSDMWHDYERHSSLIQPIM